MEANPILERDAPIVQNSYGETMLLKRGDAFRLGDKYYVVVGNDHVEKLAATKGKKIKPRPNPYKEFYQSKMRTRR